MDRSFVFGLGLALASLFLQYAVKEMPPVVVYTGLILGALLMILAALPVSFSLDIPELMMLTGALVFCFGVFFYVERKIAPAAAPDQAPQVEGGAAPAPPINELPIVDRRAGMLRHRTQLEEAAQRASGNPVRVNMQPGEAGALIVPMDGRAPYEFETQVAHFWGAWLTRNPDVRRFTICRNCASGQQVDIRQLHEILAQSESLEIGQRAFLEMGDGATIQLILTGVQWYREEDPVDELRFNYEVYDDGRFLIDAL
jgi:hypothetical protein